MTWLVAVAVLGAGSQACRDSWEFEHWKRAGLEAPCVFLSSKWPRQKQVAAMVTRWKLTEAQASCAFDAARAKEPEAAWLECVKSHPTSLPLWAGMLERWSQRLSTDPVLAAIDMSTPPGRDFAQALLAVPGAPAGAIAVQLATQWPPAARQLLERTDVMVQTRFEVALATTATSDGPTFVSALLTLPAEMGLLKLMAELWLALPANARGLNEPIPSLTTCAEPGHCDPTYDLRPALALGLVLQGDLKTARQLLQHLPRVEGVRLSRGDETRLELARLLTGAATADAWEFAVAHADDFYGIDDATALATFASAHTALFTTYGPTLGSRPGAFSRMAADRLEAARHEAWKRHSAMLPSKPAPDAGVVTLPPRPPTFQERSQPWRGPLPRLTKSKPAAGFRVLHSERVAATTVSLATSQRFDPTGEVSEGGAWLLIEPDSPRMRSQQVYLGLPVHRPYVLAKKQRAPVLDAQGIVRLTVDEAPLDDRSITFPPVALRAETTRRGVMLEVPLAVLTQDSDGDGVADLVEDRLLLHPGLADTDGDGLLDGVDPSPRVDDRQVGPAAEVTAAVFSRLHPTTGRRTLATTGFDFSSMEVTFVQRDGVDVTGFFANARAIAVTSAELEALNARYGVVFPLELEVVMNGTDHAFVRFSYGWRGGIFRVDRDADGRWVVHSLGSWVT